MKVRENRLVVRLITVIIVATIVCAIGLPLAGSKVFLRSDTLLRWAPWNENTSIDVELTSIPVADPVDSGFPAQHQFQERVFSGDLPLWNPFPAGGTPLASLPNQGLFDPLNLPFWFLPDHIAPAWVKVLELITAISGMFLLLRRLGASQSAGLLSGLVYAFSGFQTVWTNWPQTHVGAYLPWLFWAGESLARRIDIRAPLWISLITAAMLLSGFPAVTAWGAATLILYVLMRSWCFHKDLYRLLGQSISLLASFALGIGLAAWQLLPFLFQMRSIDLGHRIQTAADHLSSSLLATAAVPTAFGSHEQGFFYGDRNYIESVAFLGAGALVLVSFSLFKKRPSNVSEWATPIIAFLVFLTTTLIFFGGPLLSAAQKLPVFDSNFIGRMRSIWLLLLSILVGLGLETVISVSRTAPGKLKASKNNFGLLGTAITLLCVAFSIYYVLERGHAEGVTSKIALPVAIAVGAASCVALLAYAARRNYSWSKFSPVFITLIASAEILLFVLPFWPRIDSDKHYPNTPAHEFLAANANGDRIAAHDLAFYTGTTTYYEIRTLTGHTFHPPTWSDLLEAVDPLALTRSPTFSFIEFLDVQRLNSAILDRLAVRWLVTQVDFPIIGEPFAGPEITGSQKAVTRTALSTVVASRPIRGIEITATEDLHTTDLAARLEVEITSSNGDVIRSGRHVRGLLPKGRHWIPIAGEQLSSKGQIEISVRLEGTNGDMTLGTTQNGQLAVNLMLPGTEQLRLAYADDVVIWENLNAVDRIRFASDIAIVPDSSERIQLLTSPLPPQVVVLSEQVDHVTGSYGGKATISEIVDTYDELAITIFSEDPGYLVVADALQDGWIAFVDGEPAPLINADHAVVAVPIPAGVSNVALLYSPPGLRAGVAVSVLSTLLTLTLGFITFQRSRSSESNN